MVTNEDVFYKIGKIVMLPGIMGAFLLRKVGLNELQKLPDCMFKRYTGLFCPGCGGTRAVYYTACGEIFQAFLHHPMVVYVVIIYVSFMIRVFFRRHFGKKTYKPINMERYAYIAIIILFVQFLLKNVLLMFGIVWI